ncbi:Signal transduction histidine kinase [Nonomuraea solani]|uniref:Signal transduction histidine-protein kinase/phosphatase MprB n=1 Tax=Nonomuraea solani TaxID=1144553 RepID=A0A1H5VZL8_9ACTN|nr:HAMP domain-containing sensor histidine kinase [Nonomuraea solani]SEF92468.1 Signal transduction histidine kinase [Nonomuraea solani]
MRTRLRRSLRTRLALLAGITMLLLNIVVNAFVLYGIRDEAIEIRAREVSSEALHVLQLIKRDRLPQVLDRHDLDGMQVVDPAGRPVAWTPNLAGLPRQTDAIPHPNQANDVAEVCDMPAFPGRCEIVVALRAFQPEGIWVIYAFYPTVPWYVSLEVLLFMLCVMAGLVSLAWFGVSRVVDRTLAPVSSITRRLAEITAGGGGMRVPVPDTDDEIRALADTANRTLERLEAAWEQQEIAMERQRRFAGDASHDLRSPITAMRTQVEEAMLHPEETDWAETSDEVLASLDRLQAIVTDLLTLTKLDSGAPRSREPVDLGELVALETARPRSKRVITRAPMGVVVMGDRLQLVRLLTNLLDNAERHAESQVTVTVRQEGGEAVLEVLDDGAGIAPDQRDIVFQRFTRLDASRNRDAGGTGLGLSIAREIALGHHGRLTLEDSDAGARFVLRLPAG